MQPAPRPTFLTVALPGVLGMAAALLCGAASTMHGGARSFEAEMELAHKAPDRDSKVRHLRKALALRPKHPENIKIEHRIVVLLSQVRDWVHGQGPKPDEALQLAESMLGKYDHMNYYDSEPPNSNSSAQTLVPETSILAACLSRGQGDATKARAYLWQAMTCLQRTWERRREDWLTAPPPPELPPDSPWADDMERGQERARRGFWENRRKKAAAGDCFSPLEVAVAKAAVRQYGYSFGPHKAQEVPLPMIQIIERFPGTPMARVAQGHIDRATTLTLNDLLREIPPSETSEIIPAGEAPLPQPPH